MWRKLFENTLITLTGLLIAITFCYGVVSAQTVIQVRQGGTGWGNFQSGYLLFGNGTGALATSTNLFWNTSLSRLTITGDLTATNSTTTNATSTAFFATTASSTNLYATTGSIGSLTVTGTLTGDLTGNADTATALAANGANCTAGSFPLGVNASGAAESCTDAFTQAENDAAAYIALTDLSATFPITYNSGTGAFGFGGLSTSTTPTIGHLSYWTDLDTLGSVATGTLTGGDGLTVSATGYLIGSAVDVDCDTANGSTFGCLSAADWTVFNNKVSSSSLDDLVSWTGATSSLWQVSGLISTASSTFTASTTIQGILTASGGIYGNLTGTASLATALAANGANCASGSAPLGVDASGAVESCFDVWTEAENTAAAYLDASDLIAGHDVVFGNATTTHATTTNLFSTTASSTNLFTSALTVNGYGFTVGGAPTLNDWFDQSVKTTANVSFNNITANGTTLLLDSAGTATFANDRAATSNFGSFVWRTAGTDQWSFQMRNDSTNTLHMRDNINGSSLFQLYQGATPGFLLTASTSIIGNVNHVGNSTSSNAFTGTASSTKLYGAALRDCAGTDNKLTWTAGFFGCETDETGAGGGDFAWDVEDDGVSTSTRLLFGNGFISQASSTIDSSLTITGNATATNLYIPDAGSISFNNGDVTLTDGTDYITLAGGGLRTTAAGIGINKANSASIGLEVKADSTFTQGIRVESDLATRLGFSGFVTGDSQVRFTFRPDGLMGWGDGTNVTDTNLYRNAANELKTDDNLVVALNATMTNATATAFFSTTASSTNLFANLVTLGSNILKIIGNAVTLLGAWDFGEATSVEIPNSTAPTVDAAGGLALDTTSNNLILATSTNAGGFVVASATSTLAAFSLASTSPDAIDKGIKDIPVNRTKARTAVAIYCSVKAGTSQQIFFSDGTNDTNTITCTTTPTQFALTSNASWNAYENWRVELATKSGDWDYLDVEILGYKTTD